MKGLIGDRVNWFLCVLFFFVFAPLFAQDLQSLDKIFPSLDSEIKKSALSSSGYSASQRFDVNTKLNIVTTDQSINIASFITKKNPSFIFESMYILDIKNKTETNENLLKLYNGLSKIKKMKGRKYYSSTRGRDIVLFTESSRIESEKSNKEIDDPSDYTKLPKYENIYIRLKDANFGNCYFNAQINIQGNAIFFSLTNYKSVNFIFPVIKANDFEIHVYLQQIKEGLLIYAVAGIEISDFIANHVNISSSIQKRLDVMYGWAIDVIN